MIKAVNLTWLPLFAKGSHFGLSHTSDQQKTTGYLLSSLEFKKKILRIVWFPLQMIFTNMCRKQFRVFFILFIPYFTNLAIFPATASGIQFIFALYSFESIRNTLGHPTRS